MKKEHETELEELTLRYETLRPAERLGVDHRFHWAIASVALVALGIFVWIEAGPAAPLGYFGGFMLAAVGLACGRIALDLWTAGTAYSDLVELDDCRVTTRQPFTARARNRTNVLQRLEERIVRLEKKIYG